MANQYAIVPYTGGGTSIAAGGGDEAGGKSHYVGLSNQGATCYMNSLLQNLYMTPEFRRALYSWKYDKEKDDDEEDCIPFQLQKLFAQLQCSSQRSVETRDLTKSFGWTQAESFTQHDVQELCRVLFDALERTFAGHPTCASLVNDLYQGRLLDYVLCRRCHHESSREDTYLDVSLVLKPFGATEQLKSVAESLEHFLKPEVMDGDNQVFCEKCDSKQDAVKGMKFKALPYLLTLQLKRFDFDYTTFQKIKLNDEVRFPMYLDMNEYVADGSGAGTEGDGSDAMPQIRTGLQRTISLERRGLMKMDGGKEEGAGEEGTKKAEDEEEEGAAPDDPTLPDLVDSKGQKHPEQAAEEARRAEAARAPEEREQDPEALLANGPWVYELYAVLVHSGGAFGGHYYAYIKSFDDQKWYNFNDSMVSPISVDQVKKAWGGKWGQNSYSTGIGTNTRYYQSSANAYMLMYRRVDKGRNQTLPTREELPDYVMDFVAKEDARLAAEAEAWKRKANSIKVKLIRGNREKLVPADKAGTLRALLETARDTFWPPATPADEKDKGEKEEPNPAEDETAAEVADILTGAPSGPSPTALAEGGGGEAEAAPAPPLDCIRLRGYNVTYKTPQAPYTREDALLSELAFHDYKQVYVETKAPGEAWEAWDPNKVTVFLLRYDPDRRAFDPEVSLAVSKLATPAELVAAVAARLKMPAAATRALKLTHLGYYKAKAEAVEGEGKQLYRDFQILEGRKLYVEACTGPVEESPALALFADELNLVRLKYNLPGKPAVDQALEADGRWTLDRLREELGRRLGIPSNSFRLLKHGPNGQEMKAGNLTLHQNTLYNNFTVYIKEGQPLAAGQCLFKFYLFDALFAPGVRGPPEGPGDGCLGPVYVPPPPPPPPPGAAGEEGAAAAAGESPEEEGPAPVAGVGGAVAQLQGWARGLGGGGGGGGGGGAGTGQWAEPDPEAEAEAELAAEEGGGGAADGFGGRDREGSVITHPNANKKSQQEAAASEGESKEGTDCRFGDLSVNAMPSDSQYSLLFSMVVSNDMMVDEVREKVHEKLVEAKLIEEGSSPYRVRVREKLNLRAGRVLRDGLPLKQSGISVLDGRELALQLLPQEERLFTVEESEGGDEGSATVMIKRPAKAHVLRACWFRRAEWRLSRVYEVALDPGLSVEAAGEHLARPAGVDPAALRVLKTQGYEALRLGDLGDAAGCALRARWLRPAGDARRLQHSALYLMDGDLLLLQDVSRALRPLTDEEAESLRSAKARAAAGYTSYYGSSGGYSTSYSYGSSSGKSTWAKDRKEAGIKIMSKKERAAEEEKKKAREEEEKKKADSNCNASEKDTVSRGTGMSKDDSDTRSFRPLSSAANRASGHLSDGDDAPEMMHTDAEVAGAGGLALFEDLM